MIRKNTVFILGAGASADFNYPIGYKLRDAICHNLKDNRPNAEKIAKALAEDEEDVPYIADAVQKFRDSFYYSSESTIDAFIQNNYEAYGNIAKLAIAQVLVEVEDDEALHANPQKNWYMNLYKAMRTNPPDDFHRNNVSFITFNYDLSLDQFIHNSLLHSSTKINDESCKQILEKIPIIHLYGQLGYLSWQNSEAPREYGSKKLTGYQFKQMAKNIKTGFDSFDVKSDTKFIKTVQLINEAENIYFIGFGFDRFNLERLPIRRMTGKYIIATSYYLDANVRKEAAEYFKKFADVNIDFVEMDSLNFILKTNLCL